jgi:anti-sigma-K factor RskA
MVNDLHVIESIPAYVLECLDEEEKHAVSEHLSLCESCRAELRAYQEVSEKLAISVLQVEPPARVKAALMASIKASLPAEKDFEGRQAVKERSRTGLFNLTPAWLVSGLLLILLLGASNLLLWQQVRELRANQPQFELISLLGTGAAPGATGMIVISLEGMHGTLVVDHLPNLPEDQQYQLWLIRNGERTSGGVFSVDEDGYGSVWVASPEPLASYQSFGVTIEPEGGSPGPTGEKVLGDDL